MILFVVLAIGALIYVLVVLFAPDRMSLPQEGWH
jgi:hypothetical protein